MRKVRWVCLLWLSSAAVVCAQTAQTAENAFRDSILHKQLVLRDFSGEDVISGSWSGSDLTLRAPQWHIAALLTVQDVKLKGEHLKIDSERKVLVRARDGSLRQTGDPESVRIEIDLNRADPATVLPKLKSKLFYPDVHDALAAIPAAFAEQIPATAEALRRLRNDAPLPACDCAARDTPACREHQPTRGGKPPRLMHAVDPEFTVAARRAKLSGGVQLALSLNQTGQISDLWIVTPLGLGLQDQAALAVKKYDFEPATCHGQAVNSVLFVDVNFRIF